MPSCISPNHSVRTSLTSCSSSIACSAGYYKCDARQPPSDGNCIPVSELCDGSFDCRGYQYSDEYQFCGGELQNGNGYPQYSGVATPGPAVHMLYQLVTNLSFYHSVSLWIAETMLFFILHVILHVLYPMLVRHQKYGNSDP